VVGRWPGDRGEDALINSVIFQRAQWFVTYFR
jgi:hypothetical protein